MENASKALIIAGAVLLAILIIVISMYLYNKTQTHVETSMDSASTQGISAHNNQFESYRGNQTGTQVSMLIGKLITNAKTFQDVAQKVPNVCCPQTTEIEFPYIIATYNEVDKEQLDEYINNLALLKNSIQKKHTYNVTFGYDTSGFISDINIYYDEHSFEERVK